MMITARIRRSACFEQLLTPSMSRIILATDLSTNALNAALYALELYGPDGHVFLLLHCYQYPIPGAGSAFGIDDVARESEAGSERFQASLRAELPGKPWPLVTECKEGGVTAVLRAYKEGADPPRLVVMGARNTEGFPHFIPGSLTADVIKRSGLPVLAVPEEARYQGLSNVLLTDDGQAVGQESVALLSDLLERTGARLHLLRMVNEEVLANAGPMGPSALEKAVGRVPHSYLHKSGEDLVPLVNEALEETRADLVVAVHHERSFLERLFHRSASARLALHTPVPLLVLQQRS